MGFPTRLYPLLCDNLISEYVDTPTPWTARDLAERLGCTDRSVYRYLGRFRRDYPQYRLRSAAGLGYMLDKRPLVKSASL